jgi:uncharacterized repeat protein (TIGR03803 family)
MNSRSLAFAFAVSFVMIGASDLIAQTQPVNVDSSVLVNPIGLSAAFGRQFTILASFDSTTGANPQAGLVQGADGNFYGTTYGGGSHGSGTVFRITPAGAITVLYSFCVRANCADGANPMAALVQAADGNFYGTTYYGGTGRNSECVLNSSCGTIFRITHEGKLTTLHSFDFTDGYNPTAGLIQGTDGDLYGATIRTAFKITLSGKLTILHHFCLTKTCLDGIGVTGLIQATDGNFYGTASDGGRFSNGTVFRMTPTGALTTLHHFCAMLGCPDGSQPTGLILDADGNLYGTTTFGGTAAAPGDGTVFRISLGGKFSTLHSFSGPPDGDQPLASLTRAEDGNFYGTTAYGGKVKCNPLPGCGTIFRVTNNGTETILYRFETGAFFPFGKLLEAPDGSFYGTTVFGGYDVGTVFHWSADPDSFFGEAHAISAPNSE